MEIPSGKRSFKKLNNIIITSYLYCHIYTTADVKLDIRNTKKSKTYDPEGLVPILLKNIGPYAIKYATQLYIPNESKMRTNQQNLTCDLSPCCDANGFRKGHNATTTLHFISDHKRPQHGQTKYAYCLGR